MAPLSPPDDGGGVLSPGRPTAIWISSADHAAGRAAALVKRRRGRDRKRHIVLAALSPPWAIYRFAGLALILGIDRAHVEALTGTVGNGVATVVVAKWVKS